MEVIGQLLGRDHSKFIELGVHVRDRDPNEFRAFVRLDDGSIVLAELDSITGRDD